VRTASLCLACDTLFADLPVLSTIVCKAVLPSRKFAIKRSFTIATINSIMVQCKD
jgi:hypothetical protein